MYLKRFAIKILQNPFVGGYARKIYYALRAELNHPTNSAGLNLDVPEIRPIHIRRSELELDRLNLLVPALSVQHVFGGIATALELFKGLGADYTNIRIILTDEPSFSSENNLDYRSWEVVSADAPDQEGPIIIPFASRYKKSIPVCAGDRFVATAWWTAFLSKKIQDQQAAIFDHDFKKFVYLIQDYEPGFYSWSSRYGLAQSTYFDSSRYIAVFNTSVLKEFFEIEGYSFDEGVSFEPKLNPALKSALLKEFRTKKRKVLIYGRPSVERNAFPVIVMALRHWIANGGGDGWEFFSAGEKHEAIDLGSGHKLVSHGKLSLEDYAKELSETAIGISLMVSPHPSYPPLEMSAFGIQVITNSYRNKNLSKEISNVSSVESLDPVAISELLNSLCEHCQWSQDSAQNLSVQYSGRFSEFSREGPIFEHVLPYVKSKLS